MTFVYSKFQADRMDQRPAYGFSNRIRAAVEKDQITPSPLDYHAEKVSLGPSSKSYSFGHRPRTNYVRDCTTPGPGEYFISEEIVRRKKVGYSFGLKPNKKRPRSHTPGPKYLVETVGTFQPQRGFSFGHRPKFGRKVSDTPGPGEYNLEKFLFKETPAYSFGVKNHKRGRSEFSRNITPSAASYRPLKVLPLILSAQSQEREFLLLSILTRQDLVNTTQTNQISADIGRVSRLD
jgi:hypothetical protein